MCHLHTLRITDYTISWSVSHCKQSMQHITDSQTAHEIHAPHFSTTPTIHVSAPALSPAPAPPAGGTGCEIDASCSEDDVSPADIAKYRFHNFMVSHCKKKAYKHVAHEILVPQFPTNHTNHVNARRNYLVYHLRLRLQLTGVVSHQLQTLWNTGSTISGERFLRNTDTWWFIGERCQEWIYSRLAGSGCPHVRVSPGFAWLLTPIIPLTATHRLLRHHGNSTTKGHARLLGVFQPFLLGLGTGGTCFVIGLNLLKICAMYKLQRLPKHLHYTQKIV